MNRINIKINLSQLISAVRVEKAASGDVKCLIIPIEQNHLFEGKSGIYLDATAFELKNPKEGSRDTHLIKQSLPKEVYEPMTEEQRRSMPIIGNLAVYEPTQTTVSSAEPIKDDDDLPF